MRGDDEIVCRHASMKMTTPTQTTVKVCEGGVCFGFSRDADIAGVAGVAGVATARLCPYDSPLHLRSYQE